MTCFLKHVSNTVEFTNGEPETDTLRAPIVQGQFATRQEAVNHAQFLQRGGNAGRKVAFKGGDGRERVVIANFRIDGDCEPCTVTWRNGLSIVEDV